MLIKDYIVTKSNQSHPCTEGYQPKSKPVASNGYQPAKSEGSSNTQAVRTPPPKKP